MATKPEPTPTQQTGTHTQTTYTAQTHHTSIPTVVVSLMIHDNIYKFVYLYMYCQDPTDGELSLRSATSGEPLVESAILMQIVRCSWRKER